MSMFLERLSRAWSSLRVDRVVATGAACIAIAAMSACATEGKVTGKSCESGRYLRFEFNDPRFGGDVGFVVCTPADGERLSDAEIVRRGVFYRDIRELREAIGAGGTIVPAGTTPEASRYEGRLFVQRWDAARVSPSGASAAELRASKGVIVFAFKGLEGRDMGLVVAMRNRSTTIEHEARSSAVFRNQEELRRVLDEHGMAPDEVVTVTAEAMQESPVLSGV